MLLSKTEFYEWLTSINIDHSYKELKSSYTFSELKNYEIFMVSPIDLTIKWNENNEEVKSIYISSNNRYVMVEYLHTKKILLKSNIDNFHEKHIRKSNIISYIEFYLMKINPNYFKNIVRNNKINDLLK